MSRKLRTWHPMQQIAISAGHPMSQDLADFDSDHPVMKALRMYRDWLIQRLGDSPDNPTVPTISEMINLKSSTTFQKILSDRLSGHRRKSWYEAAKTPDFRIRYISTARAARTRRHGSWHSHATPTLTVEATTCRTMICHRLGADIPGIIQARCRCRCNTKRRPGWIDRKGVHLVAQCPRGNQRFIAHT